MIINILVVHHLSGYFETRSAVDTPASTLRMRITGTSARRPELLRMRSSSANTPRPILQVPGIMRESCKEESS